MIWILIVLYVAYHVYKSLTVSIENNVYYQQVESSNLQLCTDSIECSYLVNCAYAHWLCTDVVINAPCPHYSQRGFQIQFQNIYVSIIRFLLKNIKKRIQVFVRNFSSNRNVDNISNSQQGEKKTIFEIRTCSRKKFRLISENFLFE